MLRRGLCTAVLCWALTSNAMAQNASESPEVRTAREHFERAEQRYEAADYALALNEYQQSYNILRSVNHPNAGLVLFNVARCYGRLNQDREAIATYRQFLIEAPASATEQRADAQAELEELQARQSLRGGGGGISPIGPIIAGIGAAAVIAGAITGGLALAANDAAEANCVEGLCPPENEARNQEAQALGYATDGLLFPGLAIAATGIVLIFVLPDESTAPVSAACSGEGCMLFAQGVF